MAQLISPITISLTIIQLHVLGTLQSSSVYTEGIPSVMVSRMMFLILEVAKVEEVEG